MPNYILNRTHTHRSINGVVSFEKGQPAWVIPLLEREVVAIGAVRADGEDGVELLDPVKQAPQPMSADQRLDELHAAFGLLIERNDSKDFTGAGSPTVKAVEKIIGFDTDRSEIEGAWAEYKVLKAEG